MSVYFTLTGAQAERKTPTYCIKCGAICEKTLKKTGEHYNGETGELVGEFHVVVRCPQHRGWLSGGPFSGHTASEKPSQATPFS